jgi:hypothetical protein
MPCPPPRSDAAPVGELQLHAVARKRSAAAGRLIASAHLADCER